MERRLARLLLIRTALFLAPFAVWFAWAAWSRARGREPAGAPWTWLFAGAALLVALSLMGTAVFRTDNRHEAYVPAEAQADGSVRPSSPRPR